MKLILPILLVVATAILVAVGIALPGTAPHTVGIASGSALPGLSVKPDTADHALALLLGALQHHNWEQAFSVIANASELDKRAFTQDWTGSEGSLRTFSALEGYDLWPLHSNSNDAQIRARLKWTTPVGPVEEVRDFHLTRASDEWRVVWPKIQLPRVPTQVLPVTYLRWDVVTAGTPDEWGAHNLDAPRVRIISMNAVDSAAGAVVMGEVENEDAIPAFVNVNATLVDANGSSIDDENSFDKIAHILLPKEVSPYRIDFPGVGLEKVKNVQMHVKAALVPASADPVIGVMNQKLEQDLQGNPVLRGELMNQSGEVVNIPHVIASFYDNNGRVMWVADGYVDHALLPQQSQPFAVQVPRSLAPKVKSFRVVVNQYSLEKS